MLKPVFTHVGFSNSKDIDILLEDRGLLHQGQHLRDIRFREFPNDHTYLRCCVESPSPRSRVLQPLAHCLARCSCCRVITARQC